MSTDDTAAALQPPDGEDNTDAVQVIPDPPAAIENLVEEGNSKYTKKHLEGGLSKPEISWRDRQRWLLERGYLLRPRYRPDWVPSWIGTKKTYLDTEDGIALAYGRLVDATRVSDGAIVMLKETLKSVHPFEVEIAQYFSTGPVASDPRNHCVPVYEILQDPRDDNIAIMVMPLLREQLYPPMDTVGEAVEAFRQFFEGLHFMHEHHVAHRDCMVLNIMMDPGMFPKLFHPQYPFRNLTYTGRPKYYSRTERPPKYYFIDFGISRKYDGDNISPRAIPIMGGDKSAPEFQGEGCCIESDPFPTDVYYLGNVIRKHYLEKYLGLEFMEDLVQDMTKLEPTSRPTMVEVVSRFDQIRSGIPYKHLRRRLVNRQETSMSHFFLGIKHAFVTVGYAIRRLPPVPVPKT